MPNLNTLPLDRYQDISSTDKNLFNQFISLYDAGDFNGAKAVLDEISLACKGKTSNIFNQIINALNRMENAYIENVQEYLANLLSSLEEIKYVGVYDSATAYNKNNIVAYNDEIYLCLYDITAGTLPTVEAYWLYLGLKGDDGCGYIEALNYLGDWEGYSTAYVFHVGDMVLEDSTIYYCKVENSNKRPSENPTYWTVFMYENRQEIEGTDKLYEIYGVKGVGFENTELERTHDSVGLTYEKFPNPDTVTESVSNSQITPLNNTIGGDYIQATNIIEYGNFPLVTARWVSEHGTPSFADNIFSLTGDGTYDTVSVYQTTNSIYAAGKKIRLACKVRVDNDDCVKLEVLVKSSAAPVGEKISVQSIGNPDALIWKDIDSIVTLPSGYGGSLMVYVEQTYAGSADADGKIMQLKEFYAVDLTETFGTSQEPELAECQRILPSYFEGRKMFDLDKGGVFQDIKEQEWDATNLITNGDFSDGTTDWIIQSGFNATVSNNIMTVLANAVGQVEHNVSVILNHKYLMMAEIKATSSSVGISLGVANQASHSGNGTYEVLSVIVTAGDTVITGFRLRDQRVSGWDNFYVKNVRCIDLTSTFGAGNEPDLSQCQKTFSTYFNGINKVWYNLNPEVRFVDKEYFANQINYNGDFSSGTTGYESPYSNLSISSGNLRVTGDGSGSSVGFFFYPWVPVIANKYLYVVKCRVTNSVCQKIIIEAPVSSNHVSEILNPVINQWYYLYYITDNALPAVEVITSHQYQDGGTASGKVMEVDYNMIIDLTATFGAGYEPTLTECQSLFPSYFDGEKKIWYTNGGGMQDLLLKGYTSTQLLINGGFSNGTTGWGYTDNLLKVNNNMLVIGNGTSSPSIYIDNATNVVENEKYYYKFRLRVTNTVCTQILVYIGGAGLSNQQLFSQYTPTKDLWYETTGILTIPTGSYGSVRLTLRHSYADNATANGKTLEIDGSYGVSLINLTTDKGAGNEPNLATCRTLYPNYFDGTVSSDKGEVSVIGKNLFDSDRWYNFLQTYGVESTYPTSSGNDGTYSYIKVNPSGHYNLEFMKGDFLPNTQYTISYTGKTDIAGYTSLVVVHTDGTFLFNTLSTSWQQFSITSTVGKTIESITIGYTNVSYGYYANIQLELGTTATAYEPYNPTRARYPKLQSVPAITDTFDVLNGVHTKNVQRYVLTADDVTGLTTSGTYNDYAIIRKPINYIGYENSTAISGRLVMIGSNGDTTYTDSLSKIGYICTGGTYVFVYVVAKGTYADIAAARTALTGTVIYYQLAEPVLTQFPQTQFPLLEGSSIQNTPCVYDSGLYGTSFGITDTDYPITSLTEVLRNGVPIDTSTCVIAGDGLSFTSNLLIVNDTVEIRYVSSTQSIVPTTEYTFNTPSLTTSRIYSDFDNHFPYSEIEEVTDSYGNVFVRIPKFYTYRDANSIAISEHKISDLWELNPVFMFGGEERDYIYIGKYEASGSTSRIYSKPSQNVLVNITRTQGRTASLANGSTYFQSDIWVNQLLRDLFTVEFATTNSQSIMYGYAKNNTVAISTGNTDTVPTSTGSPTNNESGNYASKYRAVENVWGNVYKFIDGVTSYGNAIYVAYDPSLYIDGNINNHNLIGYNTIPQITAGKYADINGFDKYNPFAIIPISVGDDSQAGYSDEFYKENNNTHYLIWREGGYWDSEYGAGIWLLRGSTVTNDIYTGTRLCAYDIT